MARPSESDAETMADGVSVYVELCKQQNFLPTIEGLAVHLGWRSTLYDWADPKSDVYRAGNAGRTR
jgi:hypothetical protein